MKLILKELQKNSKLHAFIRKCYGKTFGLWWLKELYAKRIGFYNGEKRIKLLGKKTPENLISEKIKSRKPFMIARYGSTEFRTLFSKNLDNLCLYSGFFPKDKKLLKKFREQYFEDSKQIDILAIWNYKNQFNRKKKWLRNFPNIKYLIPLGSVGGIGNSWLKELKNKKILVIHPFKKTIEKQMKKRKKLGILPKLKNLEVIQAVQTIAGNKDPKFKDWFEALDYMKKEIDKKDFDIALIGCGAYGLPLAAHVKSLDKQAIHLGGSLQLLFGIKGKRWEEYKIFTKHWIYPLEEDTPQNIKKVEGGCYW